MASKGTTDAELWEALEGLDDDFVDANFPEAEADARLVALGLDPLELNTSGEAFVARVREQERLAWMDVARRNRDRLEAGASKVSRVQTMTKGEILARLDELRKADPEVDTVIVLAARKRKAEESTVEELQALLEDVETLRAIERGDEE
jgi:hypothetical protein